MLFDQAIIELMNQAVGKLPQLDTFVWELANDHFFKMTPMVLILWGFLVCKKLHFSPEQS